LRRQQGLFATRDIGCGGSKGCLPRETLAAAAARAVCRERHWRQRKLRLFAARDICGRGSGARVRVIPATSATPVGEETARSAEAVRTVAPSQMGWDIPAAREEMLSTSGMLAGVLQVLAMQEGAGSFRAESRFTAVTQTVASRTGGRSC
jgi:hypothetical protein